MWNSEPSGGAQLQIQDFCRGEGGAQKSKVADVVKQSPEQSELCATRFRTFKQTLEAQIYAFCHRLFLSHF